MRSAPRGFVVLGDAYATFNPVYGHGMSVAALAAVALRDGLRRHGTVGTAAIQRGIAKASNAAWNMATDQDRRYAQTTGPRPGPLARQAFRFQDWVMAKAVHNRTVTEVQLRVFGLAAPVSELLRPRILLSALASPRRPGLAEPPFTEQERRVLSPAPN